MTVGAGRAIGVWGTAARLAVGALLVGCPNAPAARAVLAECLHRLGLTILVRERVGDYPSPTILADGVDVMTDRNGVPPMRACRLDVPTASRVLPARCTRRSCAASPPPAGPRTRRRWPPPTPTNPHPTATAPPSGQPTDTSCPPPRPPTTCAPHRTPLQIGHELRRTGEQRNPGHVSVGQRPGHDHRAAVAAYRGAGQALRRHEGMGLIYTLGRFPRERFRGWGLQPASQCARVR